MGVYEYTLWSRAACAVPDLAARRASPPGALGRSARLRSWLLVGDRSEDALVADGAARGAWSVGAARRVVAAEFGAGSSPVVLPGLLDPLLPALSRPRRRAPPCDFGATMPCRSQGLAPQRVMKDNDVRKYGFL